MNRYDTRGLALATCGTRRYALDDENSPATRGTGVGAIVAILQGSHAIQIDTPGYLEYVPAY